jgi:transposase
MKEIMPKLNDDDKSLMEKYLQAGQVKHKYARRVQIVLQRAKGQSAQQIADNFNVARSSVSVIVKRYNEGGIDSLLHDKTRKPGIPPVSEELKNDICNVACHEKPRDETHWSTRTLAKRFGIGKSTINKILRERDIKPHIVSYYQFSADPLFKEKLTDIVGMYQNPPDNAIVLCVDEKSDIQALERSQPMLPFAEHSPQKMSNDYYRHGTTTLFAALDMLTGNVEGKINPCHKSKEFISFLRQLDRNNDKGKVLHIILDNYSAHKSKETNGYLAKHEGRFVLHFTPTHSSWANMIERWFAEITNKRISRESWTSVEELTDAIKEYIKTWNKSGRKFVWHKKPDVIIDSVERARTHAASAV